MPERVAQVVDVCRRATKRVLEPAGYVMLWKESEVSVRDRRLDPNGAVVRFLAA